MNTVATWNWGGCGTGEGSGTGHHATVPALGPVELGRVGARVDTCPQEMLLQRPRSRGPAKADE